MNLRIITKNLADDSKIGSPLKIDFKAEWTHESMPTAWVLSSSPDLGARNNFGKFQKFFEKKFFFCCFIFLNNILYGTTDGLIENRRVL